MDDSRLRFKSPDEEALLRIDRISVENFRAFSHLSVSFDPYLTVLVAPNGGGKTAVLDALAVAVGPFVGAFDEATGVHFSAADCRIESSRAHGLREEEPQYPIEVCVNGEIGGVASTWMRQLTSAKSHTTYADCRNLIEYAKQLQRRVRETASSQGEGVTLPLVSYYGTGRLWNEKRLTLGRRFEARTSRTAGYTNCLDSASKYKIFVDWFERLTMAQFQERNNPEVFAMLQARSDAIRQAVDTVLAPSGWSGIAFRSAEAGITATHRTKGVLPVDWLSDGVRNLIGLTADIAHRAVRLNSHMGVEAALQTPGIVLIDEIDMHLHPSWQQTVVASMRQAFPRMQFIVTTHSPQVLTTVRAANIRLLSEDATVQIPAEVGTFGAASSRVLEEVFGVPSRPESVSVVAQLRDYLRMVDDGRSKSLEALLLRKELEDALGTHDPDLLLADIRASQIEFIGRR